MSFSKVEWLKEEQKEYPMTDKGYKRLLEKFQRDDWSDDYDPEKEIWGADYDAMWCDE